MRDGRREVAPPAVVSSQQALLAEGQKYALSTKCGRCDEIFILLCSQGTISSCATNTGPGIPLGLIFGKICCDRACSDEECINIC